MDTVIPRKNKKNTYLVVGGVLFLIMVFLGYSMVNQKQSLNVNRSELSIKTVEKAVFEDFLNLQANVEPMNSMLVNVIEGGAIQEIFVNNGDVVSKGQPLARLYNPNTDLNYMQQETAIIEQINNLNKAKLDLRNQELNLAKDLLSIEHDFQDAQNLYDLNKKLYDQEILAKNEWEKTQENYRFQKERIKIIKQSVTKEKQANALQLGQMNQSIATMEKSLQILRKNKTNFLILAPVSGRLSSFEPVLGKTYTQGQSLGKIDVMKGYKLLSEVDEYYLDKVKVGQKGIITVASKSYKVIVVRIIPEIKSGRFQVELNFENAEGLDLRQGLSFSIRLLLSGATESIVLSKGSFADDTDGKWVFVVNGNKAIRHPVTFSRENPLYFEVKSGLQPGDQVITSSYKDYKESEILNLEN